MFEPTNTTGDSTTSFPLPLTPGAHAATHLSDVGANRGHIPEALLMAAAIELLATADTANNLTDACQRISSRLAAHLSAQRVIVLWRMGDSNSFRMVADTETFNDQQPNESQERLAVAAAEEVAARRGSVVWPAKNHGDRAASLAIQQLGVAIQVESILGTSLVAVDGSNLGVLLVCGSNDPTADNFLRSIAMPMAGRLRSIDRLTPTRIESAIRGVTSLANRKRRKLTFAILFVVAAILMLPIKYKVPAELELQPIEQRFVAAPFNGALQSAHVRPGDTVKTGDLLANIDPRELEFELAGIRAELNRAVQERKGKLADHDSAGSQIAALETERLRLKSELLQFRRGNLAIRSPVDGVVVTGDLKRSEGMPLNRGETLFEIAPLGKMVVELAIEEDDFAHVRPGMSASFYVHALPGRKWRGTIERIHQRAELRRETNVFVAEIEITDPENILRPGMNGHATIVSDRHTLAWNLFHKPYYALRRAVGW